MKKLSKAQQTLIDMVNEGWRLKPFVIFHPACQFSTSVAKITFKSLVKRNVIESDEGEYYHLTEQYKTAPGSGIPEKSE